MSGAHALSRGHCSWFVCARAGPRTSPVCGAGQAGGEALHAGGARAGLLSEVSRSAPTLFIHTCWVHVALSLDELLLLVDI